MTAEKLKIERKLENEIKGVRNALKNLRSPDDVEKVAAILGSIDNDATSYVLDELLNSSFRESEIAMASSILKNHSLEGSHGREIFEPAMNNLEKSTASLIVSEENVVALLQMASLLKGLVARGKVNAVGLVARTKDLPCKAMTGFSRLELAEFGGRGADTLTQKIKEFFSKKNLAEVKQQGAALDAVTVTIETDPQTCQKSKLEAEISLSTRKIALLEKEIGQLGGKIDQLEKEINQLTQKITSLIFPRLDWLLGRLGFKSSHVTVENKKLELNKIDAVYSKKRQELIYLSNLNWDSKLEINHLRKAKVENNQIIAPLLTQLVEKTAWNTQDDKSRAAAVKMIRACLNQVDVSDVHRQNVESCIFDQVSEAMNSGNQGRRSYCPRLFSAPSSGLSNLSIESLKSAIQTVIAPAESRKIETAEPVSKNETQRPFN